MFHANDTTDGQEQITCIKQNIVKFNIKNRLKY